MSMKDYLIPVGWTVQYFEEADPNSPPKAAIVTASYPGNMVDLVLIDRSGGELQMKKSVAHWDSDRIKNHPAVASEDGGWGWVPGFPMPPERVPRIRLANGKWIETQDKTEIKVCEMIVAGKTSGEIEQAVRRPGWNQEKIQETAQKWGLLIAATVGA